MRIPQSRSRVAYCSRCNSLAAGLILLTSFAHAQVEEEEEEVFTLSPFQVDGSDDAGYRASSTLAGTRLSSSLEDIGSAVSVVTKEFMDDIGAYDNETVLAYTLGTEVAGPSGNFSGVDPARDVDQGTVHEEGYFANPSGRNRVRGLSRADNTRNLFLSDVPWDGYITDRIDIQRGPNAMLFGLGEPAGVINASTLSANFGGDRGEAQLRLDKFGTIRVNAEYNKELIEEQLAVRVALLRHDQKFRREPAFEKDDREYVAMTYRPKFANTDSIRFELSGNYEHGSITSNLPRSLPPANYMTQFFRTVEEGGMGQNTVDYRDFETRNSNASSVPGRETLFERGVQYSINGGISDTYGSDFYMSGLNSRGTLNSSGAVGNNTTYARTQGVHLQWQIPAQGRGDPALLSPENQLWDSVGKLRQPVIMDTNVYNAFNMQFDGDTKREYRDWDALNFELTNTYFNDRVGLNVAYYNESVDASRYALMNSNNQRVYVDLMETYIDPVINGDGSVSFTANPNVGRPYVQHTLGSANTSFNERESIRAGLYAEYDFRDADEGWLGKLLGRQRINFLHEAQEVKIDSRGQRPGGFGPEFYEAAQFGRNYGQFASLASFRHYLSDQDLRSLSSEGQVRLTDISPNLFELSEGPVSVRYWDRTWTGAVSDDPSAEWISPDGETLTQSANLANYAGWTNGDFTFYNLSNPDRMVEGIGMNMTAGEYLTQNARLSRREIDSNVVVFQSYLWNDSIVGTYGYREDTDRNGILNAPAIANFNNRTEDLSPGVYNYDLIDLDEADGDNTNWSVVAHLNKLLGERDFIPVRVSLFYNKGENQTTTGANARDVFNRPLGDRRGQTTDKGVLFQTKDGRYSLRVTEYETSIVNEDAAVGTTFRPQQTLATPSRISKEIKVGELDDVLADMPESDRSYLLNTAMPAWDALMVRFETDPMFDGFQDQLVENGMLSDFTLEEVDNEGNVTNQPTEVSFSEVRVTRDVQSTGYEFEFTANITQQWRLAINSAKTKAVIRNSPGESMDLFFDTLDDAIYNTAAGDMLFNIDGTTLREDEVWRLWRPVVLGDRALNGLTQPEISEWRHSLVTNYSFVEGPLRGFNVGGSFRYQDAPIIDYQLIDDPDAGIVADQSKPFYGKGHDEMALFFGYRMELRDNVTWRIQLNLNNFYGKNEFIPVTIDADGTPSVVRVQEGSSWALTNSFTF